MKITRRQLKQLILEEMNKTNALLESMEQAAVQAAVAAAASPDPVVDIMNAAVANLDWSGAPEYEGMPTELDDTPLKTWWQSKRPSEVSAQLWDDQRIPAYEALQQAD